MRIELDGRHPVRRGCAAHHRAAFPNAMLSEHAIVAPRGMAALEKSCRIGQPLERVRASELEPFPRENGDAIIGHREVTRRERKRARGLKADEYEYE